MADPSLLDRCIDISSTEIRERLAKNKNVDYLLPSSIHDYIKTKKLYQKRAGRFELIHQSFSFGEPTEFGWQVLPDTTGWGPFYLAVVKRVR